MVTFTSFLPKPADVKTHLIPILDTLLRSIDKKRSLRLSQSLQCDWLF